MCRSRVGVCGSDSRSAGRRQGRTQVEQADQKLTGRAESGKLNWT